MTLKIKPAPVRKTLMVEAPAEHCFDVFTAGFSRWWPRSHHIGASEMKGGVIEPRAGGRWYEIGEDGSECQWGDVLVWEPPSRLVLAWRLGADFTYDPALLTEVEVTFTPAGGDRTRVDLEHRLIENMGERAAEARESVDSPGGWGSILAAFADIAKTR